MGTLLPIGRTDIDRKMIKDLIKDIAYDNISLSQGLTRAKLISAKIKNDVFRQWLNKELEGYGFNDQMLPSYRKITATIYFKVELPFGRWQTLPYLLSNNARKKDKDYTELIETHKVQQPISIIEKNLASLTTQKGEIPMPQGITDLITQQYQRQVEEHGGVIRSSYREITRTQFEAIIELTKQKLLDTLLSLDEEFPNLTNEFNMTKDNEDKVKNIITTNIYGNNNPLNIASGNKVEQSNTITFTEENHKTLEQLGVDKNDIANLKSIIETKNTDKSTLKSKALKWLSSVSASMTAKGLADNIPAIIENVEKLF